MTEYPRTVVLENDKLKQLIEEKTAIVMQGRELSNEIELLENDMRAVDREIVSIEKSVDTSDIDQEAKEVTEAMNAIMQQMEEVKKKLSKRLREAVPQMLIDQYDEKLKKKAELEEERRRLALKAQKKNDKIIPLGRKLMKPFIQDEYEDYDTLRLEDTEDGKKIIATIFSHLDSFKAAHAKRVAASK